VTQRSFRRSYTVVVFILLASLDNVAAVLVPPLYQPIAGALGVPEVALAVTTGSSAMVLAFASVGWAYLGDRRNRKPLLVVATLIWVAGTLATGFAPSFWVFLVAQIFGAVGLGAVGSVGFSVVSDLITPRRRGLAMSFWGLSQGVGTLTGGLVSGLLGADDWRRPFWVVAVVGSAATAAYLFTSDIHRGASEPLLAQAYAGGREYDYRISRADLGVIWRRRTNVWLVLQGLTAQLVFGSLVFIPRLFQAKAEALGIPQGLAIQVASVYAALFSVGAALSVLGGIVGDRLQRRTPRGRATVAAVGILAGIPFYLVLLFMPLRIDLSKGRGPVLSVLLTVVTDPIMAASFLTAVLALALTSANSPNWYALITEVNPPEHRGTVYSLGNVTNGVGRAIGNSAAGATFRALQRTLPSPLNFVVGLAAFQVFFIPTGIMYLLAARSSPKDIGDLQHLLAARAEAAHQGGG
jgi:MFS family permease